MYLFRLENLFRENIHTNSSQYFFAEKWENSNKVHNISI